MLYRCPYSYVLIVTSPRTEHSEHRLWRKRLTLGDQWADRRRINRRALDHSVCKRRTSASNSPSALVISIRSTNSIMPFLIPKIDNTPSTERSCPFSPYLEVRHLIQVEAVRRTCRPCRQQRTLIDPHLRRYIRRFYPGFHSSDIPTVSTRMTS